MAKKCCKSEPPCRNCPKRAKKKGPPKVAPTAQAIAVIGCFRRSADAGP